MQRRQSERRVRSSDKPRRRQRCPTLLLALLAVSCGTGEGFYDFADADLKPPVLLEVQVPDARTLLLEFDEPVSPVDGAFRLSPRIAIETAGPGGDGGAANAVSADDPQADPHLRITFAQDQKPGGEYRIEGVVEDAAGNSLTFIIPFYGRNDRLPAMVINEFITRGSGRHPDLAEIFCSTGGNLAGACLYAGTPGEWDARYVFPPAEVPAGSYLLVHFRPQGNAEELDETDDPALSGGYDASFEAWDFWVTGGTGLSGNNGALTLCASPHGEMVDAVLYSDRTSASDDRYRGFGSKAVLAMADELTEAGVWSCAGGMAAPEDAVDPDGSTGTRSICRSSGSRDSDNRDDWHIVPTRGATFGTMNDDAVYEQ